MPSPHLGVQTQFLLWVTQAYLTQYHEDLGLFVRTKGQQLLHACSYTSTLLNPCLFNFPRSRKPFIALIHKYDQRLTYTFKYHFKIIHFWDKMESRLIYPLQVIEFWSLPVYLAPSLYSFISALLSSYLWDLDSKTFHLIKWTEWLFNLKQSFSSRKLLLSNYS